MDFPQPAGSTTRPPPAASAAAASATRNRAAVMAELRRLLPRLGEDRRQAPLPFGLETIDSHLPDGGLASGALHEVVPASEGAVACAFGFIAAILARLSFPSLILLIMPTYGLRPYRPHGRLYGHGLRTALGLDPARVILVETAQRKETLWALEEALHSQAPAAVVGAIDTLDLKSSQRLHLAATEAGLPLLLLRPAPSLPSPASGGGWGGGSAAATRWRIGTAPAARDRFGLIARPRWRLELERCRNGRPGEWVVEYDHVAHRFSLAAALADCSRARGAGEDAIANRRRA
jgi:protein ImuA